jgi:hypothetical protein
MATISPVRARLLALTLLKVSAVALVLSIATPVAAAQPRGRRGARLRAKNQRLQKLLRSHIPPIIIGDGSLTIRTDSYEPDEHQPSGNTDRPHKYKKNHGAAITRVSVISITHDGSPTSHMVGYPSRGGEVWIFLQQEDGQGGYQDVRRGRPQIIVRNSQEIEIDKETLRPNKCHPVPGNERKCIFQHEPYGDAHFRIGEVRFRPHGSSPYPATMWRDSDRSQVIIRIHYNLPDR